MNYFAYRSTGFAIKAITGLSRANIRVHGQENIPAGTSIFVANHFTRLETVFLTEQIFQLTGKKPVWSLAAAELFDSSLGNFLDAMGAVSTKDPNRDKLIVKSLLTGEASWIFYPEGRMVKDKKIYDNGRYVVGFAGGKHPPHTGAANLALRTEFYRQRLWRLSERYPDETARLLELYQIEDIESVRRQPTHIVPVNITYFPIRAHENLIKTIADRIIEDMPERMAEEIMTESTMLLSGVDIDVRFGTPIDVKSFTHAEEIARDIGCTDCFDFDDAIPSLPALRLSALDLTKRYMDSIYRMTTVNPEHIFASILRWLPSKRIDADDLKRRAYLAVADHLEGLEIHCHPLLRDNPIHLLSDDRQKQFAEFMLLVVEKGILKKVGNGYEKDKSKLLSSPVNDVEQWHRARLDNPVGVIANEVEPLVNLQRRLKRLARLPAWYVKRKIPRLLLNRGLEEFDRDHARFYIASETRDKEIGRPFLLKGRSRSMGIVLLHGYLAAPYEVKELAEYLNRLGHWVYVPRVRGHGTAPEDLAATTYEDWVNSVDEGYAIMRSLCRMVVMGGFSNGAGLALDAAERLPDVAAVFAICPPLKLQNYASRFAPALDMWNRAMSKFGGEAAKKEFVENHPEHPHINYVRNPIAGVRQLERFMSRLEGKLAAVTVPAMVVQSVDDPVVDEKGSRKVFELLGSEHKRYILFNFNRHGILLGHGARRVHRTIGSFLDDLAKGLFVSD
jgi:esterase/lipase/1-acyl-sn-glycerol-3-phosphate acyltransferase